MPFDINTLPESVEINGVIFTKTFNSDQTAFNYAGSNGEVKSWSEVAEYLGEANVGAGQESASEANEEIKTPEGASEEALNEAAKSDSDEEIVATDGSETVSNDVAADDSADAE